MAAKMAAVVEEGLIKPLEQAEDDACGTSYSGSGLSAALGAGERHDGNQNASQEHENAKQQIRNGEGLIHIFSPFFARNMLNVQKERLAVIPMSIPIQSGLSNTVNSGVITPTAKNTLPALSEMLDSRASWPTVKTGSLGAGNMMPDTFISLHSITPSSELSIDFSFVPKAYAADGSALSGGSRWGCAAARMAASAARIAAGFVEKSYLMPNRVIGGGAMYLLGLQNQKSSEGTGGTSNVPAASSQTRQPRLTEAFDRGGGGVVVVVSANFAKTPQKAPGIVERVREGLKKFGQKLGELIPLLPVSQRELVPVRAGNALETDTSTLARFTAAAKDLSGCLSDTGLARRVYAADKDEKTSTCHWLLRAPWKVMLGTGGAIDILTRLVIAVHPRIDPSQTTLPPYVPPMRAVNPLVCENGSCQGGCSSGYTCDQSSGCCTAKSGYTDSICSSNGIAEIRRKFTDDNMLFNDTEIKGCSVKGCVNGKCIEYSDDVPNAPACSSIPNDFASNFEDSSYMPATPCRGEKGIEWRLGLSMGDLKKYSCSKDGRSIVEVSSGKAIHSCSKESDCITFGDEGFIDCVPKRLGMKFFSEKYKDCNPLQTRNDGLICTTKGLQCVTGQIIPKSDVTTLGCDLLCVDGGLGTVKLASPLNCSPKKRAYQDFVCTNNNGKYETYWEDKSEVDKKEFVASCSQGCSYGMCTGTRGNACSTEGEQKMREDGNCLLECRNGVLQETSSCGKFQILSYNNEGRWTILRSLNLLPESLLKNAKYTTIRHTWNPYLNFFGHTVYGVAIDFIDLADLTNTNSPDQKKSIIHEFFHEWAYEKNSWYPNWMPLGDIMNVIPMIGSVSKQGIAPVPEEYRALVGCQKNNGKFNYAPQAQPVTGYGGRPGDQVECGEDFADSAAWYVVHACELKEKSLMRYNYFKDTMFAGREYCEGK